MKKYEKEILQSQLDQEKKVLKKLEKNYQDALDEINSKIELLLARQDADMQHVIYQVEYQKALKTQVQTILDTLHTNEFETVSEYLTKSYDEGFLSTMYSLQSQNIPLVFPIDQAQVVAAIQEETKLSESLYTAMGKDITELRKKIAGEISRGISTGMMSADIARNISSWARIPQNNAMRIARTESHRIQNKAISDAQHRAKAKGADVVKIWSAALDGKTRTNHRKLDGQIRELEDAFEVDGHKAMYPGGFGRPEEDCNCRCRCNSKARWLLGEDFTKWTGDDEIVQIKARDYADFKEEYYHLLDERKESERVREDAQKMNDKSAELQKLEKQFSDMTDGYSYDDFIKDFGSIEEGFDGSGDAEIKKAREISEKIKSLRSELNVGKQVAKNAIHTKQESIEILRDWGIDFKDTSSNPISDEVLSKYVDFITDFENTHSSYFGQNKVKLKSISIVDNVKGHTAASGVYRDGSNAIELKRSRIQSKQSSDLSKSDDFELHGLAHEYGHYIADTLEKNHGVTDADVVQRAINRYYDGDIFKSTKDLKDCLSAYGSTRYNEAFAEAFAEAYTCKEPRKFARLFKEELEKSVKSSTIELQADINKMITSYEKKVLEAVPKKSGFFDFAAHGAAESIEYGSKDKVMSAREVANIIRHNESYNGEKVRLLSCSTGSKDDGFAQQLANALGVEVEAPTDVLIVAPDGRMKVGYDGSGEMKVFKPQGKE